MKSRSDPCAKAQRMYQKGDTKSALDNFAKCAKILTKSLQKASHQDKSAIKFNLAKVTYFQGLISLQSQSIKNSGTFFTKAINLLQNLPSAKLIDNLLGEVHQSMAVVSLFKKEDPSQHLLISKEYFEKSGDFTSMIKVNFRLADTYTDLSKKLIVAKEIQKLSKKISDKKLKGRYKAQGQLFEGKILNEMDNDNAKSVLLKAKKTFGKIKFEEGMAETIIELAMIEEKFSPSNTEEMLLEAMDLAKIIQSKRLLGVINTRLGILSFKQGKFDKGKKRLMLGLKYRSESGDKDGSAHALMELARISLISARNEKDMENAEKLINQSVSLYTEGDNDYSKALALELSSTILTRLQKYELSIEHAKASRKIFRKYKNKDAEARILVQLGVAMDGKGNKDEVLPIFEKSLKLYSDINSDTGIAEVNYLIGLHLSSHDNQQALVHLNQSLGIYDELKNKSKDMALMYNLVKDKIKELN